jgi:hypothetical protein
MTLTGPSFKAIAWEARDEDGSDIRPRIPWLTRPKQPSSLRTATGHLITARWHERATDSPESRYRS